MFGAEVRQLRREWNRLQRSGCRSWYNSSKEGKCDNQRRKLWSKFTAAVPVTVSGGVLRPKWAVMAANSVTYRPSGYNSSHPVHQHQQGMDQKLLTFGLPRNALTLVSGEREGVRLARTQGCCCANTVCVSHKWNSHVVWKCSTPYSRCTTEYCSKFSKSLGFRIRLQQRSILMQHCIRMGKKKGRIALVNERSPLLWVIQEFQVMLMPVITRVSKDISWENVVLAAIKWLAESQRYCHYKHKNASVVLVFHLFLPCRVFSALLQQRCGPTRILRASAGLPCGWGKRHQAAGSYHRKPASQSVLVA